MALCWTLDALYVALQGVFIGAEGRKVPDKVAHEIWYPDNIKVPQKLGFCRGIAAFLGNCGFFWSVNLGACFWKCDPGSSSWDFEIT